jgi:hypothetical protein
MSREIAIKMYQEIYGQVPKPTPQEEFDYELMIASGTFEEQQLKFDILRHAKTAQLTNDIEFGEIALAQWNQLYPNNQYSNLDLLIGVEYES